MNNPRMLRAMLYLLTLLAAGVLLAACGNSNKKSTSPAVAVPLSQATKTGMRSCATCHTVVTADWLASGHGNRAPEGGLDGTGIPTLGQLAGCAANCHDPDGDSAELVAGYTGNAARPVVGCEACHGPGSLHADSGGSGPIGRSAKAAGAIGTVAVSAQFMTCTECHELLSPADPANTPATAAHDAGGSDPRVAPAGVNPNRNSITGTHFARPGSWSDTDGLNTHNTTSDFTAIAGYAMDFSDEKVCSGCHNPHKSAAINREWALSAHADRQGARQDSASGAPLGPPGQKGLFSSAWAHYNWSCNGSNVIACGGTTAAPGDRRQCQRCHTTTGFIAYADALGTGNGDLAARIRLGQEPLLAYAPDFKPEMLKCNGCHTDNRGTLRNPGPVTANYDYLSGGTTYAQSSHTYPDLTGSNVCLACHTGRESGDTIKNLVLSGPTITSFLNIPFVNSHYLTAGGTVFRVTGYTFGARNYENISAYRHDKIGTSAAPNTGTNGPCIGCHLSRPGKNGNHLFLPVSRVSSGETVTITGIASEVCFTCHGPNDTVILDLVREQKELLVQSLDALKDRLERRGYLFADAHPYFFTLRSAGTASVTQGSALVTLVSGTFPSTIIGADATPVKDRFRVNSDGTYYAVKSRDSDTQITLQAPYAGLSAAAAEFTLTGDPVTNWVTAPDTDATGAVSGKNNMGAAFNFNLLKHDPGAYAHNRYYVKRLIYDSLDWLDDQELNFSVGTTLAAVCETTPQPWCGGAETYLLPNGVVNGVAAERP